jgi:site-specific recombinase XerD
MRRWDGLVDAYIEEYVARGISAGMIDNVRRELERWGNWMKRRRPRPKLEEIEAELLIRYIQQRTPFRSKATVYSVMSRMRGMGDFLVRQRVWIANPLRWMQGPKLTPYHRMPKRIDTRAMEALWAAASERHGGYQRQLSITLLALLYGTGLRRGELERLDVGDWNREDGALRIDGRKTGRQRSVPVAELVYRCIETYLPLRHNQLERLGRIDQAALFVSRDGRRLSAASISLTVHRLARRAGVELRSLHQFRHTCASDLIAAGVRLPEVQRILGHSGIGTTMRYLHVADPERRAAIARHPINDWLTEAA